LNIRKKIRRLFQSQYQLKSEYETPANFKEELHRQCNTLLLPISLLALFSWLMFIPLDKMLYSNKFILPYLRGGLSIIGLVCLIIYFTPFFRKRGYWLIMIILYYMGMAVGIIQGLVGIDPIYMGGYAIAILVIALVPLQRIHALSLLLISLSIFWIIKSFNNVKSITPDQRFGIYNLAISIVISLIAINLFNRIRANSFENRQQLLQTNKELYKVNELKSQLLHVVAHDLKDPLQVIIGYTELLKLRSKENKFVQERLKIIYRSSQRMIKLITELLEITSLESGKITTYKEEIEFDSILEESLKNFQISSQKKNQKLYSTIEKKCLILGDGSLLKQSIDHLISNAIIFSPPGKSIWIALGKHNNKIVFKVKDEGPGLSEDEISSIFDKFQRLSPKPTCGEISIGLGLAITKDVIEMHNGTINVTSELGKGSTFIVTLPAHQNGMHEKNKKVTGSIT